MPTYVVSQETGPVDPNFQEALVRLEETTCAAVADIKILVAEILAKKVPLHRPQSYSDSHVEMYGEPPTHTCLTLPEYNNTEFRGRVHKLLQKLFKLKRTFVRKAKQQQHRESGFDQVCEEILYMPGLGEGYRAAQANFEQLGGCFH